VAKRVYKVDVALSAEMGPALLVDTGAYQGLAGSEFFAGMIEMAKRAGWADYIKTKYMYRKVTGDGARAQVCTVERTVPWMLETGTCITYNAPEIPDSSVPGLFLLKAMDENNIALVPRRNIAVVIPEGKEDDIIWPEGSQTIQLYRADTGHMMMPVSRFDMKYKKEGGKGRHFTTDLGLPVDGHKKVSFADNVERHAPGQ
jgi:hypothetical protein